MSLSDLYTKEIVCFVYRSNMLLASFLSYIEKTKKGKGNKEKVGMWTQTLCLPTGALRVHRHRGQLCGNKTYCLPRFVCLCGLKFLLYLPTGWLWVHRKKGWFGGEPHLLPPPVFDLWQSILISVFGYWNVPIYILVVLFVLNQPPLDQWQVGHSQFWNKHTGRSPRSKAWIFR